MPVPIAEVIKSARARIIDLLSCDPHAAFRISEVATTLQINYETARIHLWNLWQEDKLERIETARKGIFYHWKTGET